MRKGRYKHFDPHYLQTSRLTDEHTKYTNDVTMSIWLPSGKGVPIPAPAIVKGSPVGMWFKTQYDSTTFNNRPILHIYLADGTRASNPRLGGGLIYDIEGQRKQKGKQGAEHGSEK